jgi:MYXO-CTERM domain-containing protein
VLLAAAVPAHAETRFEANAGQWNPRVRFVARQPHATWFLTDRGATVALGSVTVELALVGATPSVPRGEQELGARSNFFVGDRSRWRTSVPNYARVRTQDQVPGVDVVWHDGKGGLEYDLEIAAGTDARTLAFDVTGARGLRIARDGSLEIATTAGTLVEQPPRVIQNARELPARYRIDHGRVRFALAGYDPSAPVVIDPVVRYATYAGGSGYDTAVAVAVDAAGNAYITGETTSTDLPGTTGGPAGGSDAYVTKLAADGATVVYSTYIGGTGQDSGTSIAVDAGGHAFITGNTSSTNFPATTGAFQTSMRGAADTFVVELAPAGDTFVYATYLGGNNDNDYAGAIAIDAAGNAYVTGRTQSATWPTTTGALLTTKCATMATYDCAYVSKVAAGGASLAYSTFLGAADGSTGAAIAVDTAGSAYVTGRVPVSVNAAGRFPTTTGAFQTTCPIGVHGYVAKLTPAGDALVYATYLHSTGANHNEDMTGIAVDSAGSAYVVGSTDAATFPTTVGAYQTASAGSNDTLVVKLNAAGSALAYSTYLGGTSADIGRAIALDAAGDAFVAGYTSSTDFPTTTDAPEQTYPGASSYDAFAARLDAAGAVLTWGTYLGGSAFTQAYGIAVSAQGATYVAGYASGAYPTTAGAVQTSYGGGTDAFVTKLIGGHLADACGLAADCLSGFCVDGVCCESACSDQCSACDVAGSEGSCMPVTGAPHGSREACALSACACDGTNTDRCTNNGAECTIGVCADDHTLHNPDGSTSDCTPYKCSASGACAAACTSVDDCVAPNICDPSGKCIPLPEQETPGGCACRSTPNGWSVWWIGIVGFLVLRRRRRS